MISIIGSLAIFTIKKVFWKIGVGGRKGGEGRKAYGRGLIDFSRQMIENRIG